MCQNDNITRFPPNGHRCVKLYYLQFITIFMKKNAFYQKNDVTLHPNKKHETGMRKYNIAMIIVAAILLELTSSIQYYMARRGVEKDMVQKASVDMEQNQRVTRVKAEVESAVHNYAATMRNAIETPDNYYSLSARMVIDNPHIVGAGIAFRPGYYARLGKDELYAPYAYDEHPDITAQNLKKKKKAVPQVCTRLLPFDYTNRDWYRHTLSSDSCFWTDPYVDKGGTFIVMCTYTMPIKDGTGRNVGVLFADVPLEEVTTMGNSLYEGIDRSGLIVFILQIVGVLIMALIIWRAAVVYKRQESKKKADPEKEQLTQKVLKLTEVNRKLVKRNMELAEKLQKLSQSTNTYYYQ